jgi:repressor LexA
MLETVMHELTQRQKQVLDYIIACIDQHGYPPTQREISEHIGTSGTVTALRHLEALERKGHISRREGSSRSIVVTGRSGMPVSLPIVGTVRAGKPQPAIEDIEGYCLVDPHWIRRPGCFFLRVKGDSMIEAHILDGDLALIRPQPIAEQGEIVVALVNGEATLKRFYRDRDRIRLQPENSSMQPIIIKGGEAEAVIVGKLLKIIRNFD